MASFLLLIIIVYHKFPSFIIFLVILYKYYRNKVLNNNIKRWAELEGGLCCVGMESKSVIWTDKKGVIC